MILLGGWGCFLRGGLPPPRGGASSGGGSAPWGDLVETPPWTATAAGGTHPTQMHSCFHIYLKNSIMPVKSSSIQVNQHPKNLSPSTKE